MGDMVHGAVRRLFQALGIVTAAFLIAFPMLAWRLTTGPIVLDFLTPYIEAALSDADGTYSVTLDGTVLTWGEGDRMLEIRALGVKAFTGGDQAVASVPEVALTLNGRALLAGQLAPNSVVLRGARLHLVREADGSFQLGVGEEISATGSENVVAATLDALMGEPVPGQPGRHLKRAAVIDAEVVVEDRALDTVWRSPDTDLAFIRTPEGIAVEGALVLQVGEGASGRVSGRAHYRRGEDAVSGEVRLADIRPAALARLGGPLAHLAALDLPLSGSATGEATLAGKILSLSLDLSGGEGFVDLPAPVNARHRVAGLTLKGSLGKDLAQARVEELSLDLGGPTATLSAVADGLTGGGDAVIKAEIAVREVGFDALPALWPAHLAPDPRAWVVSNLSKGIVREARATVSARAPGGNFDALAIEHFGGEMRGDGVTVDYLRPMAPVRNAAAVATFDADELRISAKGGEVYGLRIKDGTIVLGGLSKRDQFADISLEIAGPLGDALRLIDSKPLGYAKALGVDPATAGGMANTKLSLKFPLLKNLRLDDVAVKAHASLKGGSLPKVAMGLDLTAADLEIDVDAKGLDASGPVALGGMPARLEWRENFSAKGQKFRSRYKLIAPAVDEAQRKLLGLDGPPFVAPFLSGPVGADVVATLTGGGRGEIEAKLDLSPARMELPGLGWRKEERTTGGAEVTVRLERMKVAAIPVFLVQAGDLSSRGSVSFDGEGRARRVEFHKLAYGRTQVGGTLSLRPGGGMDVAVKGASLDAEPMISTSDEEKLRRAEGRPRQKTDLPPMAVSAEVGKLWVSRNGAVQDAQVSLSRDGEEWRSLTLKGQVGDKRVPLVASLGAGGPGKRAFKVVSEDAGAVARTFDVYQDMVGGRLLVDGHIDDSLPGQPFVGTLRVSDYKIINAPVLAHLLTVAALTGVLDVLQGEGISFASLEAPFALSEGLLEIQDGRAYGASLGITAKGQVDLDRGRMAIEGTVVPAYAINSVLGNIPLLGWIVTGGEKGGGLVAFNYSMKGASASPSVTVNPLSVLTPGFLRNLFRIFDDGTGTEARKKAPAPKPPEAPPAQ